MTEQKKQDALSRCFLIHCTCTLITRFNLKEVEDAVDLLLVSVAGRVSVCEVGCDARSNVTEEERSARHEDDVEEELPVVDGKTDLRSWRERNINTNTMLEEQ